MEKTTCCIILKELKNAEIQYHSGILSNGLGNLSTFSFDCTTASFPFHQSCGCQCVCCKVPKMYGVSMGWWCQSQGCLEAFSHELVAAFAQLESIWNQKENEKKRKRKKAETFKNCWTEKIGFVQIAACCLDPCRSKLLKGLMQSKRLTGSNWFQTSLWNHTEVNLPYWAFS